MWVNREMWAFPYLNLNISSYYNSNQYLQTMPDIVETPFTEALLDHFEKPMSVSDIYAQIDKAWDEFLTLISQPACAPVNEDDDLPF